MIQTIAKTATFTFTKLLLLLLLLQGRMKFILFNKKDLKNK
jgi:hypothetical protein